MRTREILSVVMTPETKRAIERASDAEGITMSYLALRYLCGALAKDGYLPSARQIEPARTSAEYEMAEVA